MKKSETTGQVFLVVGATSAIAADLCRLLAARRIQLVLAARDTAACDRLRADVETRCGQPCWTVEFDAMNKEQCSGLLGRARELSESDIDGIVVCHGITPNESAPLSYDEIRRTFEVNLVSTVIVLEAAARHFTQKGRGMITAISSVAGDRGRQSNYVYGASKAGLTAYLEGLRNRLHPLGIQVTTIEPGFVDTPMTKGFKAPPRFLVATPDRVATDIAEAILRRCDVLYTPWFWRWIMTIICLIPRPVFKRMKL
jgi:short-subunit dehydrogenase